MNIKHNKTEVSGYKDIWIFAEHDHNRIVEVTWEVLGKARELANRLSEKVVAVLLGFGMTGEARKLIAYGADRVYLANHPLLTGFLEEAYTDIWEDLSKNTRPNIILIGATAAGRILAAKLAARFQTGLTADCTALEIEAGTKNLLQIRPAFGGNLFASIVCPAHRPQMATVRPGIFRRMTPDWRRFGRIIPVNWSETGLTSRLELLDLVETAPETDVLDNAEVIVAGGRGLVNRENFELLYELAEAMGGVVAASRAAVDAGWIDSRYQIGQTGRVVRPKIYLACGIHGAAQHLVGMQAAERIMAINHDPEAPIFKVADYGIVGDLRQVLPRLLEQLSHAPLKEEFPKHTG